MSGFESFLARIASRLEPVEPSSSPAVPASPDTARAAVMLCLRPLPGPGADTGAQTAQVLFIRRADRKGDPWSGHIALPGGRGEGTDPSLLDVAIRETREEVGIDARREGRILGRLPTLRPLSARLPPLEVTPFVAAVGPDAVVRAQEDEVADTFWLSLATLSSGGRSASVRFGDRGEFPAYPSPAGPIWGITERILTGFIELIK